MLTKTQFVTFSSRLLSNRCPWRWENWRENSERNESPRALFGCDTHSQIFPGNKTFGPFYKITLLIALAPLPPER
jgi:hypothetical protein